MPSSGFEYWKNGRPIIPGSTNDGDFSFWKDSQLIVTKGDQLPSNFALAASGSSTAAIAILNGQGNRLVAAGTSQATIRFVPLKRLVRCVPRGAFPTRERHSFAQFILNLRHMRIKGLGVLGGFVLVDDSGNAIVTDDGHGIQVPRSPDTAIQLSAAGTSTASIGMSQNKDFSLAASGTSTASMDILDAAGYPFPQRDVYTDAAFNSAFQVYEPSYAGVLAYNNDVNQPAYSFTGSNGNNVVCFGSAAWTLQAWFNNGYSSAAFVLDPSDTPIGTYPFAGGDSLGGLTQATIT